MEKLPGFTPSRPGMERVLLRKLPSLFLGGMAVPAVFAVLVHLLRPDWKIGLFVAAGIAMFDFLAVLTLAFGCALVIVMKGHAWGADVYHLPDDRDRRR